jgi:hypothetical protein
VLALATGQWAHLAVTLSGSTGTFHVNGVVAANSTEIFYSPFRLGATNQNWIDDFRIYRSALTAKEALELVNS